MKYLNNHLILRLTFFHADIPYEQVQVAWQFEGLETMQKAVEGEWEY